MLAGSGIIHINHTFNSQKDKLGDCGYDLAVRFDPVIGAFRHLISC